jgi:uncharacterized UPF0146 family protein
MLKQHLIESGVFDFEGLCKHCEKKQMEIFYLDDDEALARNITGYCRKCAEVYALVLFRDLQQLILELDDEMDYNLYLNFLTNWNERLGRDVSCFENKYQDNYNR